MIHSLAHKFARLNFIVCEIAVFGILLVVLNEVFARYILNQPTQSSLEITEYLLVACGILPLAGILKDKRHVGVDIVINLMSHKGQWICRIASNALTTLFALIVCYYGFQLAHHAFVTDGKSSSLLAFPLWIAYAVIPVGFASLALTALSETLLAIKQSEEPT